MSKAKKAAVGAAVALVAGLTLTNVAVLAGGGPFTDVGEEHPFSDEIAWMAEAGISQGYEDGTYRPGAPVTRQAMSAFMQRLNASFHLVHESRDPTSSEIISMAADCGPNERVLAGGHSIQGSPTHVVLRSYPSHGATDSWYVFWQTTDGQPANPSLVEVWALCAPAEQASTVEM